MFHPSASHRASLRAPERAQHAHHRLGPHDGQPLLQRRTHGTRRAAHLPPRLALVREPRDAHPALVDARARRLVAHHARHRLALALEPARQPAQRDAPERHERVRDGALGERGPQQPSRVRHRGEERDAARGAAAQRECRENTKGEAGQGGGGDGALVGCVGFAEEEAVVRGESVGLISVEGVCEGPDRAVWSGREREGERSVLDEEAAVGAACGWVEGRRRGKGGRGGGGAFFEDGVPGLRGRRVGGHWMVLSLFELFSRAARCRERERIVVW